MIVERSKLGEGRTSCAFGIDSVSFSPSLREVSIPDYATNKAATFKKPSAHAMYGKQTFLKPQEYQS